LEYWRDSVIGVEGLNGDWCRIDSLATEPTRQMLYDYFLHRIWKDYALQNEKANEKVSDQDRYPLSITLQIQLAV
jgi:hypothetical protein